MIENDEKKKQTIEDGEMSFVDMSMVNNGDMGEQGVGNADNGMLNTMVMVE